MSRLAQAIRRVPLPLRYAGLVGVAALAVFLIWFFVFRNTPATPGGSGSAGPPPPRPALGKTLPLDEYRAAVRSALGDVQAARSLEGDERKKKLKSAADTLEKFEGAGISVAPAGGFAQVDNTAVIAQLLDPGPNVDAIESSLSLLFDSLNETGAGTGGTASGGQALSDLHSVLNDPDFNYERDLSPIERLARWLAGIMGNGESDPGLLLQRLTVSLAAGIAAGGLTYLASERLGNRWARLGLAVAVGLATGSLVYAGLTDVLTTFGVLAALGVLVALVAAALIIGGVYMTAAPSSKPHAISELAATLGMGAGEARRRANEAAGAGDYRLAIRYRCLALLLALDQAGKLHFDRTATDREYLFRAPGSLQGDLQPLLDRFEAVWYGEADATADDWSAYAARAAALEARVADEAKAA